MSGLSQLPPHCHKIIWAGVKYMHDTFVKAEHSYLGSKGGGICEVPEKSWLFGGGLGILVLMGKKKNHRTNCCSI